MFVKISAEAFDPKPKAAVETVQKAPDADAPAETPPETRKTVFGLNFGKPPVQIKGTEMDMQTRVKHTLLESLIQILWLPMQILVFSFSAIIVALLYLKTRLAGGESMNDLIERFE